MNLTTRLQTLAIVLPLLLITSTHVFAQQLPVPYISGIGQTTSIT